MPRLFDIGPLGSPDAQFNSKLRQFENSQEMMYEEQLVRDEDADEFDPTDEYDEDDWRLGGER